MVCSCELLLQTNQLHSGGNNHVVVHVLHITVFTGECKHFSPTQSSCYSIFSFKMKQVNDNVKP